MADEDAFELVELRLLVVQLRDELDNSRALNARLSEYGLSNEMEALAKVDARDATIARLREALEFYGAAENWAHRPLGLQIYSEVSMDLGKRARAALAPKGGDDADP